MCYSRGYKFSDGDLDIYKSGISLQLMGCKTANNMKGGKRRRKTKKRRRRKKYISLY